MDQNQNGTYGGDAPRTYGEESKLYEGGRAQNASDNQAYGGQPGNQQNPYGNQQQPYGSQQNPYGNQQQPYGSQQNPYGNQQQPYGYQQNPYQQPYGYQQNPYQQLYNGMPGYGMQPMPAVKDIFCYILLVIMPLRVLLTFPILRITLSYRIGYSSSFSDYMWMLQQRPYSILSALGNLLTVAYIIFVVLDVICVRSKDYKITGLILFALFLNPGYYIWRAYMLKRKMTVPIIYTVVYSLLMLVYFFYAFYLVFSMVL